MDNPTYPALFDFEDCPRCDGDLSPDHDKISCSRCDYATPLPDDLECQDDRQFTSSGLLVDFPTGGSFCPDCTGILSHESGCQVCYVCGFSKC